MPACVLVVGHQEEKVRGYFAGRKEISFAPQSEQLGTGHAVACALPELPAGRQPSLILCGDTPLLTRGDALRGMLQAHGASGAALTVMTASFAEPFGYGRIVKGADGSVQRIVEEKDASAEERQIQEVNAGVYCADARLSGGGGGGSWQRQRPGGILPDRRGAPGGAAGANCLSFPVADAEEITGVNDRVQLAEAARVLRGRINRELMLSGVTMIDPQAVYIERGVRIGRDTVIHPGVAIRGDDRDRRALRDRAGRR